MSNSKRTLFIFTTLAFLSIGQTAQAVGLTWLKWFGARCSYYLGQMGRGSKLDLDRVQNFFGQQNGPFKDQPLTPDERAMLQNIYALSRDELPLIALLSETPPSQRGFLLRRLQHDYTLLQQATKREIPVDAWLDIPGWDPIRELWARYRGKWTATPDRGQITEPTASAQVFPDQKVARFKLTTGDESLPMATAEEVLHIDALDLFEHNQGRVEGWVRKRFGKTLHPDLLVDTPLIDRNWAFQLKSDIVLAQIPDEQVRYITKFLLERDAAFKKVELYRFLAQSHPELRTRAWDDILASPDPKKKINEMLNERFHLKPETLAALQNYTIEDIIRITGGKPRKWIDFEQQHPGQTVSSPSLADVVLKTPEVLRRPAFYGPELERYTRNLPPEELKRLVAYVQSPAFSNAPYRLQRRLERVDPKQTGLSAADQRDFDNARDVYNNVGRTLLMLQEYDRYHGTHHAVQEGTALLKRLNRDPETQNHRELIGYVRQAVSESTNPKAAAMFFDGISNSPCLFGFISNSHATDNIFEILGHVKSPDEAASAKRFMLPPDSARLAEILLDHIEYNQGLGQNVVDSKANGWRLTSAVSMAEMAGKYFRRIGDLPRAEKFEARSREVQKIIDLLTN